MAKKEMKPLKVSQNKASNFRIGSEKFETEIMKEEECTVFIVTGVENGLSIKDAYSDMKMIDAMLSMKRLHFAMRKHIRTTKAGNLRKNSDLYSYYMSAIDGRVNGQF